MSGFLAEVTQVPGKKKKNLQQRLARFNRDLWLFFIDNEGVNISFGGCHYIGQEKKTTAGNRSKKEE